MDATQGTDEHRLIRVPQLTQYENGDYVTSHAQHEDAIRRMHTVVVSRAHAQAHQLPFVCHSHSEANCHNPFDKTFSINPYSSLVSPEILRDYYAHVELTVPKVRASDLSSAVVKDYERLNRLDDRLWLRAVPEHEILARKTAEERARLAEQSLVVCPIQKNRIEEMSSGEIYAWLAHRVQHQEASLMDVAKTLSRINSPIQDSTNRFIKLIVCGSSGLGKSTVCTEIAHLCGLQKSRDRCYIELNFNTCQEKGHANMIVGSPPSYIGHDDENLVDRLLSAYEEIEARDEAPVTTTTAVDANGEAMLVEDEEEETKAVIAMAERPTQRRRIIMVHIEELDKGSLEMFVALNGFLESGTLTSIKGRVFTLPRDVFLVLCASSNFAADYFNLLSEQQCNTRDITDARRAIRLAMQTKGLQDCDITRLGRCTPFFPLSYEQAHDIMRRKLREFIARGVNCLESIRCAMHMDDTQQEAFIDYLMQGHYCRQEGIRPLENLMREELEDNASSQREFVAHHLDEATPRPLAARPVLRFECIRYRAGLTLQQLLSHDACMNRRDNTDIFISARLQSCLDQHCDIAYFVLEHAEFTDRRNGIHVLTPMKRLASPSSSPLITPLRLVESSDAIDRSDIDDDDEANKTIERPKFADEEEEEIIEEIIEEAVMMPLVQEIARASVTSSSSSSCSSAKETAAATKRKRNSSEAMRSCLTSTSDTDSETPSESGVRGINANVATGKSKKKQKLIREDVSGYDWHSVISKHPTYRCQACKELVDKRYLGTHPKKCAGKPGKKHTKRVK